MTCAVFWSHNTTGIRLTIQGPTVSYSVARVVDSISSTLGNGRLTPVGESGSGESVTAWTLMGLMHKPGAVNAEWPEILRHDMLTLSTRSWRALRGNDITMMLQDPRCALDPV